MARIRTIKPEFFTDDDVIALSDTAKICFIGLWGHCDGNGVFQAKWGQLKRAIKPEQDMPKGFEALCREDLSKFLHIFESEGELYGLVLTFRRHQRTDAKNDPPRFPLPEGFVLSDQQVWVQNKTSLRREPAESPPDTSRVHDPEGRKEGKGREGKGREAHSQNLASGHGNGKPSSRYGPDGKDQFGKTREDYLREVGKR